MTQPLSGLIVLDFTTLLPGPMAGLLLAESGAKVIKIEKPEGDDMRRTPPHGVPYALLNKGKEIIFADLKNAAERAKILEFVKTADIVLEQFRPQVMARLGLDYETLKAINPRLIYCSITGYGQSGPRALEAGHDMNYIASTGLLSLSSGGAANPTVPPALVADIGGGTFPAMMNILLAVIARNNTGQGCYLDIAMVDAMFTFAFLGLANGFGGAGFPKGSDLSLTGGSARYQLYPTKDGKLVACGALEQKFWQSFCAVIGHDAKDEGIANVKAKVALQTAAYWQPLFAKADCCVTIMQSLEEALADKHFIERGLFAHQSDDGKHPALPVPISPQFRVTPK